MLNDNEILNQILGVVQGLEQRLQFVESNMATKEEIAALPTSDEVHQLVKDETKSLATKEMLEGLATKESLKELASKEMLKELATKESLKDLATKDMLADLETKTSLNDSITHEALKDLATKKETRKLQETMDRMENKQELIYNQTAKLSEYHTEVKGEFSDVKDRISFQAHKLSEAELELFKLKKTQ